MKSTALGAENIIFISDAHEKFYYEKLQEVRYQDVYHKAWAALSITSAIFAKSSGVLHAAPPTSAIGVTEIRLFTIGTPNSCAISSPVFTRSFADSVIFL